MLLAGVNKTPTRCWGLLEIRVTFGPEANIQRLRELFFNLKSNKLFHFVLLHAGKTITHFTVTATGGNEAGVDLVFI